ncbi:methyltransferase domain-containing protein [Methanocorpusculum sp. MG]|uniref:Methyltransferase domain-containing protein n=1 Tax=Methanocorpusculum petauri TaxID=3002863 RepID=A0ABT4IJ03_9EURY|nr:methyltransferase domain-containing protein [Methanocorpusculum petauri]MCZ0861541.1 methyltransferase domain-containing protein [Methanocorpusculum petauri]MDE2443879.1 methyltransferase domain-containing protein [Methanocorpusculum sp.]
MNLLFELSGENPVLATAEIGCVGTVTRTATGIALAEIPDPEMTTRLAQTHVIMELIGECDGTSAALAELLAQLDITADRPFACRVRKIHPATVDASQLDLERMMGKSIHGKVSLQSPEMEFRALFTDNRCFLGRVLYTIDRGSYAYRNPQRRAFFHPGVMMPLMARTMVNLTHVRPGELLCDPFCGTGGMLLETELMGVRSIGSDYDPEMLAGCRKNLPDGAYVRADATQMPYPDSCFDAVATDLPYGQSTTIGADSLDYLYVESLKEIRRILKKGGKAVVVTHRDIRHLAEDLFEISGYYEQRVHKSLTRRILVLS